MRHNCPPDDPVDPEVDRIWSPEHLLPGHLDFTLMCFVWTFILVFARLASFLSRHVVKKIRDRDKVNRCLVRYGPRTTTTNQTTTRTPNEPARPIWVSFCRAGKWPFNVLFFD